ncbi:uncharacterized protein ACO6RY_08169 [Pungitius sinensis]
MGCTPSKAVGVYTQDPVCRDLDTCSTYVPSLKSSVSTPERPGLCEETSNVRQTVLDVPRRDVHGWTGRSSRLEPWSAADSAAAGSPAPRCGSLEHEAPQPDPGPAR